MLTQEEQTVGAGVPVKATEESQFTSGSSGHERLQRITIPCVCEGFLAVGPRAFCGCSQDLTQSGAQREVSLRSGARARAERVPAAASEGGGDGRPSPEAVAARPLQARSHAE